MKSAQDMFKCEVCGEVGSKELIEPHEQECLERRSTETKRRQEHQLKIEKRLKDAIEIATQSKSIKLLCEQGCVDDARILCRNKAGYLWDCGTSSGWESVYDAMIDAVISEVSKPAKTLTTPVKKGELITALTKSLELQSHYAKLLNQYDGGQRWIFDSVDAWIERLRSIK
jgi:hypothetical protein